MDEIEHGGELTLEIAPERLLEVARALLGRPSAFALLCRHEWVLSDGLGRNRIEAGLAAPLRRYFAEFEPALFKETRRALREELERRTTSLPFSIPLAQPPIPRA